MLLLSAIFLPVLSAVDDMEMMASNLETNNSVDQYFEVFKSPISKEEYEIIKDPINYLYVYLHHSNHKKGVFIYDA